MGDSGDANEGGIKGLMGNESLEQFAKNQVVEQLNGRKLLDREQSLGQCTSGAELGEPHSPF